MRKSKYTAEERKERAKISAAKWRANNPEYLKKWLTEHPDYLKNWRKNNKSKVSRTNKSYYYNNKKQKEQIAPIITPQTENL